MGSHMSRDQPRISAFGDHKSQLFIDRITPQDTRVLLLFPSFAIQCYKIKMLILCPFLDVYGLLKCNIGQFLADTCFFVSMDSLIIT